MVSKSNKGGKRSEDIVAVQQTRMGARGRHEIRVTCVLDEHRGGKVNVVVGVLGIRGDV